MTTSARIVSYWLITGLLLITVSIVINWLQKGQGQAIDHHVSPINLTNGLDIPRGRYFQINGIYHVDMTGTTRLAIPIKDIPKNPARYDTVVIKGLNSKPHVNLYWQWQTPENPTPYQYQLNGYSQSTNRLPADWQNSTEISQLNLIIEVDMSLGFVNNYDTQVSWQSIELLNHSDISPLQLLSSELDTYTPLTFSSLNLFSSNNELVYRNFLIRLGVWLLLTTTLYLILKPPAIHLLLTLLMAWLTVTTVYTYNFSRQVISHNMRFTSDNLALNEIDQRLLEIANQVNASIQKDSKQPAAAKVLIMGRDQFKKYRLNYHLLNHNTGAVNTLKSIIKGSDHNNTYGILLDPYLHLCTKKLDTVKFISLTPVIQDMDYCLVRL